jgi:restriction system protein
MSFLEKISKFFQSSNTESSYLETQVQLAMKEKDVSDLTNAEEDFVMKIRDVSDLNDAEIALVMKERSLRVGFEKKYVSSMMKEWDVIDKMNEQQLMNYFISKLTPILETIPQEHWVTFYRKRRNFTIKDDYGDIDDTRWKSEFKKYFDSKLREKLELSNKDIRAMSRYIYLISNTSIENSDFFVTFGFVNNILDGQCKIHEENAQNRPTNPYEYEQYCAQILRSSGWSAFATKSSGDQGGDIKAEKDGIMVIFQCKLYSQPIGNKAVQEVSGSLRYYGADYGAVVSNMEYTRSAKELAKSNNILLLNDTYLKELNISDFKKFMK